MAPALIPADMAVSAKFGAFNIVDFNYKIVNETPVPASILIPKDAKPGLHPVLVRWHGGCLITGHRMYPDWFATWTLQLALSKSAIIITPDYRLMPDASGLDILQDVRDFYDWITAPENLASYLPQGIEADVNHLLVTGESAGGWLALQSSLLPSSRPHISAVISLYPMIDLRNPHYTGDFEKELFNPRVPQLDRSILENYVATMKKGGVITSATPPDRVPIVISFLQQGAYKDFFGDDSILYPLEALTNVSEVPPTWLIHGTADAVIPVEGTYKYETLVKDRHPHAKLHVHYDEGSDHGFDNAPTTNLDTAWVKKGLEFIGSYWPHR